MKTIQNTRGEMDSVTNQSLRTNYSQHDEVSSEETMRLIDRLEVILNKSQSSQIHADKFTMKRSFPVTWKNTPQSKVAETTTYFTKKRKNTNIKLMRIRNQLKLKISLGDIKYYEIVKLVKEIDEIRRTSMAWVMILKDERSKSSKNTSAPQIPSALNKIYFQTRLVDAFKNISYYEKFDWEDMVVEARKNIDHFRRLEEECTKSVSINGACKMKGYSCCRCY